MEGRRLLVAVPFLGALAYIVMPIVGGSGDSVTVYNVSALISLAVFWAVFALRPPRPAGPWILIGLALAGWTVGDVVYTAIGTDPTVSAADAFYIAAYLGFMVATASFLRARTRERDLDSALDATLIGIACFLFLWIGVVGPSWNDPGVSTAGRLMTALYPVLDVVLLFFLARLLLTPGRPPAAILVFVAAIAGILVADVVYAGLQQTGSYDEGPWNAIDSLWLLGYALLPLALSLGERGMLVEHEPAVLKRPSRLVGLLAAGIALVALPAADVASRTTGQPLTTAVLAVSGGLIVVVVLARIMRLHSSLDSAFAEVDRQQRYYRAVADNSSDSFVVLDRDGIVLDASGTLDGLLGYDPRAAIGGNALVVVHPDDQALARALLESAIAAPGVTVVDQLRTISVDGTPLWMELYCTNLCDDPAVGGVVVNAHDVTARKTVEAELEHRALHDALTGLANRAMLREQIERALAKRARSGSDIAVLFCDLDGFKLINDTIGHQAGDEVLRITGARFASAVRPGDTVARLGGDEFAALIESPTPLTGEPEAIAERILRTIADPVDVQGHPLVVTASVGIAVASQGGETTPDELLRDADTAMYGAKAAGRNCFVTYEPTMHTAVVDRVQIDSDLRQAVERDELTLRYQPIIDLKSRQVIGFEALLRWQHPARGLLAPSVFISIAEENGAIVDIGRWVLHRACADAEAWPLTAAGTPPVIGVNVSATQLVRSEFVDDVSAALVDSGLPASSLIIELTESILVAHPDEAAARLRALKAVGVRLAIDDFGVGQSSLSYLRQFPVDILKLDRSFIEMITTTDGVPAIIGGLLELARTLDLRTLAEGIETPAQRIALTEEGCELGQGFLFSEPVDNDAAVRMLGSPSASPLGGPLLS